MPFTPFHFGPGMAIKACGGKRLSLVVFGVSQIFMDIEPLIRLWRDDDILHGLSHTYLGATVIGLAAILLGRPLGIWALKLWNSHLSPAQHAWLGLPTAISWTAACSGALIGVYSHVLLDSIMHADIRPWAPFASTNAVLHATSHAHLHLFCLASGLVGMIALGLVYIWRRWRANAAMAPPAWERP